MAAAKKQNLDSRNKELKLQNLHRKPTTGFIKYKKEKKKNTKYQKAIKIFKYNFNFWEKNQTIFGRMDWGGWLYMVNEKSISGGPS